MKQSHLSQKGVFSIVQQTIGSFLWDLRSHFACTESWHISVMLEDRFSSLTASGKKITIPLTKKKKVRSSYEGGIKGKVNIPQALSPGYIHCSLFSSPKHQQLQSPDA